MARTLLVVDEMMLTLAVMFTNSVARNPVNNHEPTIQYTS